VSDVLALIDLDGTLVDRDTPGRIGSTPVQALALLDTA
jgi:hypothetical protein